MSQFLHLSEINCSSTDKFLEWVQELYLKFYCYCFLQPDVLHGFSTFVHECTALVEKEEEKNILLWPDLL